MKENEKEKSQMKTEETTEFGPVIPEEISDDETYGYTPENPIKIGAVNNGPMWIEEYLKSITGPSGEKIEFKQLGSYSEEATDYPIGPGALEVYQITYPNLDKPLKLYFDNYNYVRPKAPKGLKIK
ncbi:MAG: hypothetical protein PHV06_01570 [bacterium]|nr:hypothetical protein [bacterium]